ncbi:ATP-binding cassette domain-containing protein [Luteolibacter ambystomatis]|uniref:ATP-binding cassette domain-containing protein n=1 Tax=Luteolibacter ambystomatis TaxID=2824561 RepID=A0A975G8D3_9BACT|nr:ATP-binding cassette domain-containing protein [Luteolibacter ambystomatis]QUE50600.1 ATP-binding cassette domain-containing protein [Luteolibacter ambystomatis]
MNAEHPLLELRHADVWRGDNRVFHDFALTVRDDESVAILGPNGAGKSTLIKLITGELRAAAEPGTVARLFGEDLWSLEDLRHKLGLVAPEEAQRFDPEEPAEGVVLSSLRGAFGVTRWMRFSKQERARAAAAMQKAGVLDLAKRDYGTLSSGQRRRFLLARALVHEPQALLLDEPTTALDFPSSFAFIEIVRELIRSGHGVLWVTHHPSEIPPETTRVILLKDGRIFADGAPKQVLASKVLSELYGLPLKVRWSGGFCHVGPASPPP